MKSKIILAALVASSLMGCTQWKKLTNAEGSGSGNAGPQVVAASGFVPASNTLTFTPTLDASETIIGVRVRIAGVLTDLTDTPSASPYYTFDQPSGVFTFHNTTADTSGNFADNFSIYYHSPHPAGYHTVN